MCQGFGHFSVFCIILFWLNQPPAAYELQTQVNALLWVASLFPVSGAHLCPSLVINMGNQQWNNNNKVTPAYVQIDIYIYIHTLLYLYSYLHIFSQGSKLGGAMRRGLPGILQRLPQISAGSAKMYWFLFTTPSSRSSVWRCNWAPWTKLNFEPCLIYYHIFSPVRPCPHLPEALVRLPSWVYRDEAGASVGAPGSAPSPWGTGWSVAGSGRGVETPSGSTPAPSGPARKTYSSMFIEIQLEHLSELQVLLRVPGALADLLLDLVVELRLRLDQLPGLLDLQERHTVQCL